MTAGIYIPGLITPIYTPFQRGRVAMAKKKKTGEAAVIRWFDSSTIGFSIFTSQIRIRVHSKEQCSGGISLRVKRLFSGYWELARADRASEVRGICESQLCVLGREHSPQI